MVHLRVCGGPVSNPASPCAAFAGALPLELLAARWWVKAASTRPSMMAQREGNANAPFRRMADGRDPYSLFGKGPTFEHTYSRITANLVQRRVADG